MEGLEERVDDPGERDGEWDGERDDERVRQSLCVCTTTMPSARISSALSRSYATVQRNGGKR